MKNIWQEIINLTNNSNRDIEIIIGDITIGQEECEKLNIPSDSVLYSVVSNSNGLIINHWIRIWGQDSSTNYGVCHYNRNIKFDKYISGLFVVAGDILGGLFAININRFDGNNLIWYFAPDSLEWECLNMKYNEFLAWCFQGNIDDFYSTMRWENWKDDVMDINMNKAILIYPFLWAKECNIEKASRKIVDLDEIIELNFEYSGQI